MGLNYGRWDNLDVSSDEFDAETESVNSEKSNRAPSTAERDAANALFPGSSLSRLSVPGSRKKPTFVKFHESDNGAGLLDAFFEHPDNYHKHASPNCLIESWGLFPYIPPGEEGEGTQYFGGMEGMMRKMKIQMLYMGDHLRRPEDQFLDRLIENKIATLKAMDLGDLIKRDYVLRIHMPNLPDESGGDRIWRTFRVSGGMKLGVFADKVVRPLMGWTRNFHAHLFTDFRDGAMFGSSNCRSVDMMHLDMAGYGYVPEENWCIAHILHKVGDRMGWLYDLGDHWYHEIKLDEICSFEASTGAVVVLDGSGACPRENGNGNHIWAGEIETLQKGTRPERDNLINEMIGSVNYKERGWTSRKAFNIDRFDIADAQTAVQKAMDSKGSVAHGAKSFIIPMAPVGETQTQRYPLQKKEKLQQTYDPESPYGYFEEVLSDRRDKVKKTACANCGSPHDLRLCNGCKQRYYCSVTCQRAHWKTKHRAECKHGK